MKKLITIIFAAILLSSCATQKPVHINDGQHEWLALIEIKYEYGLTHKECREIVNLAYRGEIECRYNIRRELAEYTANFDYSKFNTESKLSKDK